MEFFIYYLSERSLLCLKAICMHVHNHIGIVRKICSSFVTNVRHASLINCPCEL